MLNYAGFRQVETPVFIAHVGTSRTEIICDGFKRRPHYILVGSTAVSENRSTAESSRRLGRWSRDELS
jgi:hypothetical protein